MVTTRTGSARSSPVAACNGLTAEPEAWASRSATDSHFSIIVIVPSSASWIA